MYKCESVFVCDCVYGCSACMCVWMTEYMLLIIVCLQEHMMTSSSLCNDHDIIMHSCSVCVHASICVNMCHE